MSVNNSLSPDLARMLGQSFTASSGLSVQPLAVAAKVEQVYLSNELKGQLATSFNRAMGQRWGVPPSTRPLNEGELHFLRTHTVHEINSSIARNDTNPIMQFCVQIIQTTLTQAATAVVNDMLAGNTIPDRANEERAPSHANRGPASSNTTSEVHPEDVETQGKDPELKTMKTTATADLERKAKSSVNRLVKDELPKVRTRIGEDQLLHSVGQGASLGDAASRSAEAMKSQEAFIRYAGSVVVVAAKTGVFISKVEEMGWDGATAETIKSAAIGFASKYSAKVITSLAGCTNPVWCANVVTTIIADTFSSTETAPPDRDERTPMPNVPLSEWNRSRLPDLDPAGPSIRRPR